MSVHPNDVLFEGVAQIPVLPLCEHFAGNEKLIGKAMSLQNSEMGPIFDITCDCEDGAKTGAESDHRAMVVDMINSDANQHNMAGVRVHDPENMHMIDDIDFIVRAAGERLAYITIPKARSADQVQHAIQRIIHATKEAGIDRVIPIHVLIETLGAMHDVAAIAQLPGGINLLDFGQMDYVSEFQGRIAEDQLASPGQFTNQHLVSAKTRVVEAAVRNGLVAAHNVTLDFRSDTQAGDDAGQAKALGFSRMWSIHPNQIKQIVGAMQPDVSLVGKATEILLAAQANDWGPVQHEGALQDRATYRMYWTLLQQAHTAGAKLPEEAMLWFSSLQ